MLLNGWNNGKLGYGARIFQLGTILFGLMALLHSCNPSSPYEIYISPDGDDSATGSKHNPVASLHRAAELAQTKAGKTAITIWIAGGRYQMEQPLALGIKDGGTVEKPIRWKALPGERPVISGGIRIQNWQKDESGHWVAPMSDQVKKAFRSLYVNGRRAVRARFPDAGYLRIDRAGEDNRTNFFFKANDFPLVEEMSGLELVLLHDWSMSRIGVKSIDWDRRQLIAKDSIGSRSHAFFSLTNWEQHPRYFLENAPEFLDSPGEWYGDMKERKIYYHPLADEKIEEMEAVVPLAPKLITITGDKSTRKYTGYITFEGLVFEHTAWSLPDDRYAGIQACMFDNRLNLENGWDQVPAVIEMDLARNCRLVDCVVRHTGGSGIWMRENCEACEITDNHIYDISGNGVNIGEGRDRLVNGKPWWQEAPEQVAKDNTVSHCLVENCGQQFYGAVGIWGGLVAETTIDHNEIRNLPYTGISIGWMWDTIPTPCRANTIEANHIHHIMKTLSDGGGIYNLGLQPGSRIAHNLIHDVSVNAGRAESNGMFLDEGIKDVVVEENVIYKIARSPLRFHRASVNVVRNNVLGCGEGIPPIRYNRTREVDIRKIENIILDESLPADMDTLKGIVEKKTKTIGPGKD